jgi:hypothetical protein
MDSILTTVAGALGISPITLVLLLGVVVAVCNLVGKLIPDDATGTLGLVRKVCKVLGLYISRASPAESRSMIQRGWLRESSAQKHRHESGSTVRSPAFVGVGAVFLGIATLFLGGCAAATLAGVNQAANLVCTSAPIAQALYNSAVATGDGDKINKVLSDLQAACPGVLLLIHTVPVKVELPAHPRRPFPDRSAVNDSASPISFSATGGARQAFSINS